MRKQTSLLILWVLLLSSSPINIVAAQSSSSTTLQPSKGSELEEKRRALAREIEETPAERQKHREALQALDLTLSQQISAVQEEARLKTFAPEALGAEEPTYSVLEKLRDRLRQLSAKRETLKSTRTLTERALNEAKESRTALEKTRRQLSEKVALATDPVEKARLDDELTGIQLQLRLASERVPLREFELQNERLKEANSEREERFVRSEVEKLRRTLSLTQREYQSRLEQLNRAESELQQLLEAASLDIRSSEKLLADAKLRQEAADAPSDALQEEIQSRQLTKQLREREAALLRGAIERVKLRREIWSRRLQLSLNGVDSGALAAWKEEAVRETEAYQNLIKDEETRIEELKKQLESLATKELAGTTRWTREHRQSLLRVIGAYERNASDLEGHTLLLMRFRDELSERSSSFSLGGALQRVGAAIHGVWEYEITSVDDRPITIRKVVLALIFFLVGMFISRRLSRLASSRLLSRFDLKPGATAAIEALTFYALVLTFAFVALRVVHIPLTVFTLLGGALAIGVGFGSQAIISNFISGLIILIEQPVRVGDLIEVDQLKGSVMHIGMRSTTVRTGRNTDIIVPNSFFLEKNVVNWTLNDDRVRTQVTVGVMYGSPLTRVKELLLQAANEHAYTIKEPTPVVLLTSLGDTTVGFELQVWVSLKSPVERAQIESDLRFRIYELFSANSITIHCPRRDIALHTAEPLAVTLEKA